MEEAGILTKKEDFGPKLRKVPLQVMLKSLANFQNRPIFGGDQVPPGLTMQHWVKRVLQFIPGDADLTRDLREEIMVGYVEARSEKQEVGLEAPEIHFRYDPAIRRRPRRPKASWHVEHCRAGGIKPAAFFLFPLCMDLIHISEEADALVGSVQKLSPVELILVIEFSQCAAQVEPEPGAGCQTPDDIIRNANA